MNTRLSDLIASRQKALAAARTLRDTARVAGRDLSPDELARAEAHIAEAEGLKSEISQAHGDRNVIDREIANQEAWDRQPANKPRAVIDPLDNGPGAPDQCPHPSPPSRSAPRRAAGGRRSYSALFGSSLCRDGWKSAGEFLNCIANGLSDGRLRVSSTGGSVAIGSEGGWLVPSEFAARLLDEALEFEAVRPRADVRPMQFSELRIAGFDGSDHSGALYGFQTQWVPEGGEIDVSIPRTRQIALRASKLALLTSLTSELSADMAPGSEPLLMQNLARAVGFALDDAFLNGSGAGQPLGIMRADSLVVAEKEVGQLAETVTVGNLVAMVSRLYPACFNRAVWIVHPSVLSQLLNLSHKVRDDVGDVVGGGASNLLQPDGAGGYTLLARPLLISEKMQPLGTQGDLLLVDLSEYAIGMRADLRIALSGHVYFSSDKLAVRCILRCDGQPKWSSAITPKRGTDTLSWAVTMAARAAE